MIDKLRKRLEALEAELACVHYIDNTERMLMEKARLESSIKSVKHQIAEREASLREIL